MTCQSSVRGSCANGVVASTDMGHAHGIVFLTILIMSYSYTGGILALSGDWILCHKRIRCNKLGDQTGNINILKGITNVNNACGIEITK